jgi:hypothetical protein
MRISVSSLLGRVGGLAVGAGLPAPSLIPLPDPLPLPPGRVLKKGYGDVFCPRGSSHRSASCFQTSRSVPSKPFRRGPGLGGGGGLGAGVIGFVGWFDSDQAVKGGSEMSNVGVGKL